MLALALCGFSGWRLYRRNNGQKTLQEAIDADERAIAIATRFGYTLPNAYKSLGSALKTLIEQTPKKRQRDRYIKRLEALKKSAAKAKERARVEREGMRSSAY